MKIDKLVMIYLTEKSPLQKFKEEHGIESEKLAPDHSVHSIGWSEKEQKFYGWSHRAIYGFKIGDEMKKGMCGVEDPKYPSKYSLPIGFKSKTKEDCKKMAMAFADSVS